MIELFVFSFFLQARVEMKENVDNNELSTVMDD